MKLLKLLLGLFNNTKPQRRHIKDVKSGEIINIEWKERIKGGIGKAKCLNNDPKTKKILLEITWGNYIEAKVDEKEKFILNYNSEKLKNFYLLNQIEEQPKKSEEEDYDIATLQKKMNEALEKEEYEKASELQRKIDKILQRPKQ